MLSRLYTIYKFCFFLLQPYVDYFCYNNDQLCIMKWYKTIAVHSSVLLFWFWSFKCTLRKNGQKARIKFVVVLGKRMFVSVGKKDKEKRIVYCLQPLQLLRLRWQEGSQWIMMVTRGLLGFDCCFRGGAVSPHWDSVCHVHSWTSEIKRRGMWHPPEAIRSSIHSAHYFNL